MVKESNVMVVHWKKLKRSYEKNRSDLRGLLFRKYPDFILTREVKEFKNIPVFTFHQLTTETFEPLLIYLSDSGYKTLVADELYERWNTQNFVYDKEVVLTFDDGDRSLYEVVYPLLRKYGFKGVAFIVPGLIGGEGIGPTWKSDKNYLCSWKEIKEMHESGAIDFQAHSMYHHTIYISPKIIDYVTPKTNFVFLQEAFFPVLTKDTGAQLPDSLLLGTPIYESDYRYRRKARYFDSLDLRSACQNFVNENGGHSFFANNRWRKKLDSYVNEIFSEFKKNTRYENQDERRKAIRKDLRSTKLAIEKKLSGKKVRHFCFPWFTADEATVNISGEEGYVTNYWGGFIPEFAQRNKNPVPISRVNPVYIYRLPGRHRKSLREVVRDKFFGTAYN
jgi:peptidoglycan/xylan/chitin deacetylase (PgdA/CDA1 family)